MSLEDYIKDLAPELQEKARACANTDELLALAKEAQVPVPDEALEAIAGGTDAEAGGCLTPACPQCGSTDTTCTGKDVGRGVVVEHYKCKKCGCKFDKTYS